MTELPGLRHLIRQGVRRSVAEEYRRLLRLGVQRQAAVVLAHGGARAPRPVEKTCAG